MQVTHVGLSKLNACARRVNSRGRDSAADLCSRRRFGFLDRNVAARVFEDARQVCGHAAIDRSRRKGLHPDRIVCQAMHANESSSGKLFAQLSKFRVLHQLEVYDGKLRAQSRHDGANIFDGVHSGQVLMNSNRR